MRNLQIVLYSVSLAIIAFLSSCGTSDISKVSNKLPIEIRTIGTIEEEEAKSELAILLGGVKLDDKFFVPIIKVTDITFNIDSTKIKTTIIKAPLSSIDAFSIGLTDDILDLSTYQDNLEDAEFEKDSAYAEGIKLLSSPRGKVVMLKQMASYPIKPNEFVIANSTAIKTDTANHIFSTSEELLKYLEKSKRNYTSLTLFFTGGKSPLAFVDTDGDGVMDDKDICPIDSGSIECGGCICKPKITESSQSAAKSVSNSNNKNSNCGSCGSLNLKVNQSNTKKLSWNSCPSARFIHVYVNSSSGRFRQHYKLNGSSTDYDLPIASDPVIMKDPSIPLHDKFTITIKAECGTGKIIQTSAVDNVKIKCN